MASRSMIIWLSAALWLTLVTFINQPIDLFVLLHFPDAGDGADQADYTNKEPACGGNAPGMVSRLSEGHDDVQLDQIDQLVI